MLGVWPIPVFAGFLDFLLLQDPQERNTYLVIGAWHYYKMVKIFFGRINPYTAKLD